MKKYTIKQTKFSTPVLPKLIEQKSKDNNFVLNGQNHKYVKFLIDLYNKSATHKAMIVTKSNISAGHSVTLSDNSIMDESKKEELNTWFDCINEDEETLHDVVCDMSLNYHIFGYAFLQVIWNKGKTIHSIQNIDASLIACGMAKNGKVESFYFSNDWSNWQKSENKPILLPAFNPDNIQPGKPQILMVRKKEPGLVYYSNPLYNQTTINYALQEFDLSVFLLNNTNSSFFPSAIITHLEPGITEEQQDDIVESFNDLYTGTDQKKIVHVFLNDKELKPVVDAFPQQDEYTKFLEMNKQAQNMIAVGHMIVNKNLACIPNEGGIMGDRTSIQDSFELLLKSIKITQLLFEKAINKIIKHKVEGAKIKINTSSPLQFKAFSENILSQVMTQPEIRNELGLAQLQPDDVTNLDEVRKKNPDLNNGQLVYPNSIIEQDNANKPKE